MPFGWYGHIVVFQATSLVGWQSADDLVDLGERTA